MWQNMIWIRFLLSTPLNAVRMDIIIQLLLSFWILDVGDDHELQTWFPQAFDSSHHLIRIAYHTRMQNDAHTG